ncbi:hypothetical protein HOA91_02685, partial [Candidatus Woesearchaeota archaeon]|nr:hypothetical protein [Candidatus Woesearchaeota archaeon]
MGKYIVLVAVLLILLVGCGTALAGQGYANWNYEQKQSYWGCIKENCVDFLKAKQYSEWRSCAWNCFSQADDYVPPPVEELFCEDTDNGKDYKNFGTVTDNKNPEGKDDYCYTYSSGKEYLFEGECVNNKYSYVQKSCKEVGATYSCVEGACVELVCDITEVDNGQVSDYPDCEINCNEGYILEGDICVVEFPNCIIPINGMEITEDTMLCPGEYELPNGISVFTDGVKLECNGATLNGGDSNDAGLKLYFHNGVIENCNVKNYRTGILIGVQGDVEPILSNNVLKNNKMNNNEYNFAITPGGKNSDWYINDIDTSNLVDGKPIYYIVGGQGLEINTLSNAGQVVLVNSQDITIEGLDISNVGPGILLVNTKDSSIINNNIDVTLWDGITLKHGSVNNEINGNSVMTNEYTTGVMLMESSDENTIVGNEISDSVEAIMLHHSSKNNVANNIIIGGTAGARGIEMYYSNENTINGNLFEGITCGMSRSAPLVFGYSSNNLVFENDIDENKCSFYISHSSTSNYIYKNNFVNSFLKLPFIDESSGGNLFSLNEEGNYWSNYDTPEEGCDDTNNNGVCDEPYGIDENNQDSFPFRELNGWEKEYEEILSEPEIEWKKVFDVGNGKFVQQTSDGGYIATGSSGGDAWLIKTNSQGNEEWIQTFGGNNVDVSMSVQETSEGGFILTGTTKSFGNGGYDFWLIKTDSNGNEEWTQTFGGNKDDMNCCQGIYTQQTNDGGYILTGHTKSFGNGGSDFWLIKTDETGNLIWDKTFGGDENDEATSVQQTNEGGYIITGHTKSFGNNGVYSDVWLIKTDSNGNEEWTQTFGENENINDGKFVQQTTDGGYIIAGATSSLGNYDAWLIKTDSNGNEEWTQTF